MPDRFGLKLKYDVICGLYNFNEFYSVREDMKHDVSYYTIRVNDCITAKMYLSHSFQTAHEHHLYMA